jgi:putative heme-binding domain-containing protein
MQFVRFIVRRRRRASVGYLPLLAGCVALLVSAGSVYAQRDAQIPDPDPELERQSFQIPDGWEISLYASDPLIAKPIQMNFDPAGRLWVATSATYPQIKPGQEADDKIVVLEDRDGDGRADASTVFAAGLLIPTGVVPGDGGAYIANSTELLHLKDSDGDGRADTTRVVLSGFGTEDTHHILHTFRWGPEGLLYFNQSVYIHTHLETPWGIRRLMAGGIWSLRPETMQAEVFARGWVNAWGHQFDRWGQSFVTDGAGGEGINYVVPDASYLTAYEAPRILRGLNPGQPKLCGHEILSGRHVPPDWQGTIVTNDFRGHRVARFALGDDGSGFASTRLADLVVTNHSAFRPVDVKIGPDGAIYIADFYNPIIQHGEVDFRDPRRDTTHGRIWRMKVKDRPLVERPKLVGTPVANLLAALKSPEGYTRDMAKRLLKESAAKAVLPELAAWTAKLDRADADFEHQRLEALWTYQALDIVEPDLLKAVLASPDFHARAAAMRVIYHWKDRVAGRPEVHSLLAQAIADEHPRVRLEAVCALRQLKDTASVELAMRALDKPIDPFLDYTLWQTATELQQTWMPDYLAGKAKFDDNPRHLIFALKSAASGEAVELLANLFQAGKVPPDTEQEVLSVIAERGQPAQLAIVFRFAADSKTDPARQVALLNLLQVAAAKRGVRLADQAQPLLELFRSPDESVRAAAFRLAGSWKLEASREPLNIVARSADAPRALRGAAIEALVSLGGQSSKDTLIGLTDPAQGIGVRMHAAGALAALDLRVAAERAVLVFASLPANADPTPLFDAFLRQKEGPAALEAALAGKTLPPAIAIVGVRRASAAGRDLKSLSDAITRAGSLQLAAAATPEAVAQLAASAMSEGNAQRGEAVFRRAALQCLNCHAVAGAGGKVGPDLVSIGASAQPDYLVDSLLDPSKKIKEGYHTSVIVTEDGQALTGLVVRKTEQEILLRDNTGKESVIPLKDVESVTISPKSLMPVGLHQSLRRDELLDLVRFLAELGKEGPFQAPKAQYVRSWRALAASPAADVAFRSLGLTFAAAASTAGDGQATWTPLYSTVAGVVPLDDLPKINGQVGAIFSFAQFDVEAPASGKVRLRVEDSTALEIWVDGKQVGMGPEIALELTPGGHTITLAIDRHRRQSPLRIEIASALGATQ